MIFALICITCLCHLLQISDLDFEDRIRKDIQVTNINRTVRGSEMRLIQKLGVEERMRERDKANR